MAVKRRSLLLAAGTALVAAATPDVRIRRARAAASSETGDSPADPPAPSREIAVGDRDTLEEALQNAAPGHRIVLDDGNYDGAFKLNATGTADAPIVIAARNPDGAILTGGLELAGPYGWAHALTFSGDGENPRDAPLRIGGDHVAVTRCSFVGRRGIVVTSQQYFRIGYNSFSGEPMSERSAGKDSRFDQIFLNIAAGDDARLPEHGRIYRNLFVDADRSKSESHTIYVGPSGGKPRTPSLTDLVIEYNYIDTKRRRSIYTKRGGIIRYNYVAMSRGTFGIRHGNGAQLYGNVVVGCRSAIVNGPDHDIRGNEIEFKLQSRAHGRIPQQG